MKAFKLFSMAVTALILGACSNEDNEVQESPQQARMIPFEATIGPASGANTRTVITKGTGTYENYLMVAWKGDEEIALVHNGKRDKVTVTKVNSDGSAVVTGSITALGSEGEAAKLVYPYDAVGSADGGTTYTPNTSTDFLAPGFAQDGTLDYIGNNDLDGRVGDGKLYTEGGKITIKKSATEDNVVMESKTAIWKLTLTTDGTTPLEAKQVSFYIENHLIAATSVASTGKSEWTLCVAPAALSEYTGDFTILATAGSDSYAYLKPGGITLENGKYYQSTVTMHIPIYITNPAVGQVIGSNGINYNVADFPDGLTKVAVIAYVGSDTGDATYKNGLAIACDDETSGDWGTAKNECESKSAFAGTRWCLPSNDQWRAMFIANGGYELRYNGLNTTITNAGGTALKDDGTGQYWSSTECDANNAYALNFGSNFVDYYPRKKDGTESTYYARACFAF